MYEAIFYIFAFITVAAAVCVVFSRNIIYSAFSLLFAFFGVAVIYVYLNADFIAVTQVIVYVGGILILLLFGVMLTNKISQTDLKTEVLNVPLALILMLAILGSLLYTFYFRATWVIDPKLDLSKTNSVAERIGFETMSNYVLPFEIVSIVLMVALLGAAYLARVNRREVFKQHQKN
jgi:NADH-quinone oxidoreductase subunit J